MEKQGKLITGIVIAVLALWVLGTLDRGMVNEEGPIKIGFMGPLTGDSASIGESIKRGVELAIADAALENVEVIYEDSQCDGKEAANAVNKLISIDGVLAIVGEVCSGATLVAVPVANSSGVTMVSPSSTSPKLTAAGEFFFRTIPSDALQGVFGAQLIADAGHTKLAIIYSNEEYGIGFKTVLEEAFTANGGEVVAVESFERTVTDVRTQVTKIKVARPDALFIISNSPASAVAILKQAAELRLKAAMYGSEGLKSPDILDGAGAAAEGLTLSTVSSGTSEFMIQHTETFGEGPGLFAAQGYDAFTAIANAIAGGAETGEEIRMALSQMSFDGASGHIEFDENGDVSGNYDVFTVIGGAFVAAE